MEVVDERIRAGNFEFEEVDEELDDFFAEFEVVLVQT